ncbi:MAG: hypothetical protein Q9P01_04900 [Anaerolineae bacterium]|nr:hypothetical protein [Anaerolineae bacterium]
MNTGEALMRLEGHTDIVSVLRFDESGTQLLSGSADRLIILWKIEPDVRDSFHAVRFIGHTDLINDVDFSPDEVDDTIVSGSEDRRIILWDSSTGEILQILGEQSSPITTVQFTPDGFGVVFGTLDGRVLFKGVDTSAEIIEWAENNRYILPCEALGQRDDEIESCSSET